MRIPPAILRTAVLPSLLILPAYALAQSDAKIDQQNLIAGICGTQVPLNGEGCACFAERAMAELDEPQHAYLILTVVQPPAAERHEMARSHADLKTIAGFIQGALKSCAAGGTAPAPGETAPSDSGAEEAE
jgi:hypothetical protein